MDGGHGAGGDLELVIDDLGHRCQAVCGTRCVGNDIVLRRNVLVFVYPQNDGDVLACGRSGDNDFLYSALEMSLGGLGLGELARGLDNHLGAERTPIELRGILFGKDTNFLAIDDDGVFRRFDVVAEIAENRVVLQQMGQGLRTGQIIDGYEIQLFVIQRGTKYVAADSAKSVDSNFDRHNTSWWNCFAPAKPELPEHDCGLEVAPEQKG